MLLGDVSHGGGSKVLIMVSSAIPQSHEGPAPPNPAQRNPSIVLQGTLRSPVEHRGLALACQRLPPCQGNASEAACKVPETPTGVRSK